MNLLITSAHSSGCIGTILDSTKFASRSNRLRTVVSALVCGLPLACPSAFSRGHWPVPASDQAALQYVRIFHCPYERIRWDRFFQEVDPQEQLPVDHRQELHQRLRLRYVNTNVRCRRSSSGTGHLLWWLLPFVCRKSASIISEASTLLKRLLCEHATCTTYTTSIPTPPKCQRGVDYG